MLKTWAGNYRELLQKIGNKGKLLELLLYWGSFFAVLTFFALCDIIGKSIVFPFLECTERIGIIEEERTDQREYEVNGGRKRHIEVPVISHAYLVDGYKIGVYDSHRRDYDVGDSITYYTYQLGKFELADINHYTMGHAPRNLLLSLFVLFHSYALFFADTEKEKEEREAKKQAKREAAAKKPTDKNAEQGAALWLPVTYVLYGAILLVLFWLLLCLVLFARTILFTLF